ncbi:hypothetical protein EV178_006565, partial [Coemansia sp. RSA 1646]
CSAHNAGRASRSDNTHAPRRKQLPVLRQNRAQGQLNTGVGKRQAAARQQHHGGLASFVVLFVSRHLQRNNSGLRAVSRAALYLF